MVKAAIQSELRGGAGNSFWLTTILGLV